MYVKGQRNLCDRGAFWEEAGRLAARSLWESKKQRKGGWSEEQVCVYMRAQVPRLGAVPPHPVKGTTPASRPFLLQHPWWFSVLDHSMNMLTCLPHHHKSLLLTLYLISSLPFVASFLERAACTLCTCVSPLSLPLISSCEAFSFSTLWNAPASGP